ncbi:endospore germination permease [Anaerocolumna xylanovorans]|uniref:Spore germination protein (Amino acid permease)/germination protein, Ger(X)C family n=1 Tax=Anaerocolumna xylanovorans DSM 12503 TaxID=1121345 RepID=A0A1M7YLX1_9FIRM|nr:endospore germination permease [Anaerocolumna xylanovorans]SHO53592.1 spore germination protein (amino acid permease)/germination protein, Ger(x)C family [Anaerocolumna xylanovorans DSM 12503]
MFSDNDKISLRQFTRLLVFDLFSVSGLIIPNLAAASSGRDGILAICLGTLYAFIYGYLILILCKQTGGRYLNYCDDNFGRFVTFFVAIPYIVKLFLCLVFSARIFGQVINQTLLADTDNRIIILFLLMVSAYSASKGMEVRARITEIIYFLVMVPIVLFLLLGIRKVDPANLTPLFTESMKDIGAGSYLILLTFSALEMMIFAVPMIHYRKSDIKKGKKMYNYAARAITITGILDILMYVVTMGLLGRKETADKLWSAISIFQMVKLPGGLVQRQDAFILSIWLLSIFTLTGALFYYLSYISGHILKLSNRNYLLVPLILLVFGVAVIPIDTEQFFYYFRRYMMYIGMPQSLIIPLLVACTGKLKKFINKKAVVNTVFAFIVAAGAVSLTGCSDMTEIEDRNFIQAVGIDAKGKDMIEVYYILPDLKVLTKQAAEDPKRLKLAFADKDFSEVEEDYSLENNKRLDFSQLKAIILGDGISKSKDKMNAFLTYVENKYELGRNTPVFLAEGKAGDIMDLNSDIEGGIGDYLAQLSRINLRNNGIKEIDAGDLILARNEGNRTVILPMLHADDKKMRVSGVGIYSEGAVGFYANKEESDFIYFSCGFGKNKVLYLPEDDKSNLPKYVIKINRITRTMEFREDNGKPYLDMIVEGSASIQKGLEKKEDRAKNSDIEKIEEECNAYVRENIAKTIKSICMDGKLDYMNLYPMTGYRKRSLWLDYKGRQADFLTNLSINLKVDFHIE